MPARFSHIFSFTEQKEAGPSENTTISIGLWSGGYSFMEQCPDLGLCRRLDAFTVESADPDSLPLMEMLESFAGSYPDASETRQTFRVNVFDRDFSIFPAGCHDEKALEHFHQFPGKASRDKEMFSAVSADAAYTMIYAFPIETIRAFKETFSDCSLIHSGFSLIEYGRKLSAERKSKTLLFVQFRQPLLELLLCESGKLISLQSFFAPQAGDAMYYIMAMLKVFQKNAEQIRLVYAGFPNEDENLKKMLASAFAFEYAGLPKGVAWPVKQGVLAHEWAHLTNSLL